MKTAFVALAVLALSADVARAQETRPTGSTVRVPFRAMTDQGEPVLDIKAEEVTLKVNGRARPLQSLTLVRTAVVENSSPAAALPPAYATNAASDASRTVQILIDDDSILPGRETSVREAVRRLTTSLSPGDRVGIVTPQGQVHLRPTDDFGKVLLTVDGLSGKGTPSESDVDAACRTQRLLVMLGTLVDGAGGPPITLMVFSGGISGPSAQTVTMGSGSGTCAIRPSDFQDFGRAASAAQADFYLFHVIEGLGSSGSSAQAAGFESLAGVTNGEFTRLGGSFDAAIARMLRETSAYYVAAFVPEPSEQKGQTYRVDLHVTRDRVKVKARPAVMIQKPASGTKAPSPKDMLRVQTTFSDFPVRAVGYSSRTPGNDEVKVVALFESVDPSTTLAAASVGLLDEKGTLKKQWTAQPMDLAKRPVMAALTAPPGTYRMRVAAVDASGRAGTADYDLKAEVVRADPLQLSALVVGAQQGTGFTPRIEFTDEPIAIGLLEIYGVPKNATVTVDLDVVSSPDGAPLATAPTTVSQAKTEDMRVAFGGFGIGSLPPGDYLMRATVNLDGKPVGRVVRTLHKAGRP